MLKKIYNSPSVMTWISYFAKYGSYIFVLPLILKIFSEAEIAVWFLFLLILSVSQLADSGFGPSIIRATSYFFSGSLKLPNNIDQFKNKTSISGAKINFIGLNKVLNTSNSIYLILSFFSVIILLTFGRFIVNNAINMTDNQDRLMSAFYLLVIQSFFSIQVIKCSSFIQGIDQVASLKRAEIIFETSKIVILFLLLNTGYGIFELIAVELVFKIFFYIYTRIYISNWFLYHKQSYSNDFKVDNEIFKSIWSPTWRQGLMFYGSYFSNNSVGIIISQLNDPKLIASYLLSQKIISFVRQISQAPLYSNLPRVFQLMAKSEFKTLKLYCAKGISFGLFLQFFLLLFIILFNTQLLNIFDIKTTLVSLPILIVMSITVMLELHHAFHAQIYMGSNHVPFLIPSIYSGLSIFALSFFAIGPYGLVGVVLVQFLIQLSLNNWYPVYLNLRLLKWNFFDYLFSLFNFRFFFKKSANT
jgi:hypothetical protein